MIDYSDDLEGQITIFDILDEKPTDYTYDRAEKKPCLPPCISWNGEPQEVGAMGHEVVALL